MAPQASSYELAAAACEVPEANEKAFYPEFQPFKIWGDADASATMGKVCPVVPSLREVRFLPGLTTFTLACRHLHSQVQHALSKRGVADSGMLNLFFRLSPAGEEIASKQVHHARIPCPTRTLSSVRHHVCCRRYLELKSLVLPATRTVHRLRGAARQVWL